MNERSPSRDKIDGIDLYRGLAVILMLITHSYKFYLFSPYGSNVPHGQEGVKQAFDFFLQIEPMTSAMFLLITGLSLTLSRQKAIHTYQDDWPWKRKYVLRSLQLYLLSFIQFFITYGWQFPDIFISSGILSIIAFSLLTTVLFWRFPTQDPYQNLLLLILIGAALAIPLEKGQGLPGFGTGPGAMAPLHLFSYLGSLTGLVYTRHALRGIFLCLLASASLSLTALTYSSIPWIINYTGDYQFYSAGNTGFSYIQGLIQGSARESQTQYFWGHTLMGCLRLLLPLVLLLALFLKWGQAFRRWVPFWPMAILGRNALPCFIIHLLVIDLLKSLSLEPQTPATCLLFFLALLASMVLMGFAIERLTFKKALNSPI